MAANNTPTTLGSLEFSEIKQSLTDYLKTQSVFSGYNFEGSVIQTLIDLLSYNTFYYAYYANMINAEAFLDSAQKEDSMISLCKPLGFFVPSKTAAVASITLSTLSNNNPIPAGTRFVASDSNGIEYGFYNLDEIPVVEQSTESFEVYEALRYVEFDALPTFDYDTQKINIAVTDFDVSSVKVTITERIDETTTLDQVWTRVENIGYTSRVDDNIYFLERTSTGFSILFGGINSVGRSIDNNINKITVRYITTSGSSANGLSLFTSTIGGIVTLNVESSGGKSKPNLDEVRFLAPKWFASQERAVTVNDYKALLLDSGFFSSQKEFNVFGGQDLTPPKYGRVFVTSIYQPSDERVTEIINFLKERSVVTVLPEYITTKSLNIYTDFDFSLGPSTDSRNKNSVLTRVKALFQNNYTTVGEFNVSFSASDFIEIIRANQNTDVNTIIISPDDFIVYAQESLDSNVEYTFNLQNELLLPIGVPTAITLPFESDLVDSGYQAILKMTARSVSSKNNKINLELYQLDPVTFEETQISGDFGYVIPVKGVINIKNNIIKDTAILKVEFLRKSFYISLNNLVSFNYNNITVI